MPLINLDAVLNPLPELKDRILDYIPRATTSEFGIVALGSGINVDIFGRIYLDTQEYSDRLTAIETTATSTLETTVNTLETKADELAASITQKLGTPNGIATLDSAGSIPSSQLPSYVDDVLEYASVAAFPATGETGKIYVETIGNTTYRWSGTTYIKITSGEVSSVAGKKGIVTLTKDDVGLSNVDNTNDLNKPLSTATQTALTALENKGKRGIINLYDTSLIYGLNERVVLTNGDIVKSTLPNNTANPNVDTTGWELVENSIFVPSVTKLLTKKPNENKLYNVHSYHDGGQRGGGSFVVVQSNILVENGVTVFRSNVVGYEDYFWVRVNISHITPEMAGAIGDKTYNCRDAVQKCFNVGGDLRLNENSKYLVYGDDITAHRDTYILKCTKPISITCAGKASVYFKHDVTTGSPRSITFEGVNENLASLKIEGVDWYGHETEGHANKVNRAWGIGLHGVDNYSIKRCKFSTFQGHCPDIARRVYSNNGDWIQSSDLNQANTSEAINRLMALSSKNGVIENIKIRHAGSTGLSFFGADQVSVDGVDADMTGAAYDFSVWTDDASGNTALKDYALNRGIDIKNVKGGSVALTGCTTATVTGCDVHKVIVRSYDFDQQKNNFDSGTHTYNIDDHLSAPFLWMQNGGFVRRISIYSNCLDKLDIRSISVDAYKNYFYSKSDGHEFVTCDGNSILWGNGSTHSDAYTSLGAGVKNNVTANTFILNHTNCVCVTFGTASPNSHINVTGSIIEKTNPAFVYTHMRNANQFYRRDSYYETGANNGLTLSKTINHHIEIKQGLLTQGVGSNHLKTFVNIFGSASGGQTIATFTNTTTPVYFFVTLIDIAGRLFRKKIIVAADNTITVSDLDSQTIYNVSFSVTVTSGVIELKVTSAGNDLCLDVIGLGTRGNCVFLVPKARIFSAG